MRSPAHADQAADEAAIGAAIDAMYAMISGPAGPRDWRRQREVFHPDCRQIRTGVDAAGVPWMAMFTLDEYRANADAMLANVDFHEVETARELRIFGNIAHAWSTYEARHAPEDTVPERRGINSIQLYRDVDVDVDADTVADASADGRPRWRIIHMIWDNERPGLQVTPAG